MDASPRTGVADQLGLTGSSASCRADGHGRAAYQPGILLGVLLDAYAIGVRSSRQVERRCREDLAFRVLAGNQAPDQVTVAWFRVRHEHALAGLLVESLRLCAAAGMVRLGTVALDGTKVHLAVGDAPGWAAQVLRRLTAQLTAALANVR
jgi:transposase